MTIRPMKEADVGAVAALHVQEIQLGFTSYLGGRFLRYLYKAVVLDTGSFGFVAEDEQGRIIGFVAATTKLGALYKCFMRKYAIQAAWAALPKAWRRWRVVKSIVQDLLYPSQKGPVALPQAEIVAVAVSSEAQGAGLGRALVEKALQELSSRGIQQVKVLVGEQLGANEFYRRLGFEHAGKIEYDSQKMDAHIYVKTLSGGGGDARQQ